MRFGICCSGDETAEMLGAGFDYVELGANALASDEHAFDGYRLEVTNLFFPPGIKLFGKEKTPYLETATGIVQRAAGLGVKVMVIGSGAARSAPAGFPANQANLEFAVIAAEISEVGKSLGVVIAPESLNRSETNVGNDLGQLAEQLRARGVSYTADIYHVLQEWRIDQPDAVAPDSTLWAKQIPFAPAHVHLAALDRTVPAINDVQVIAFLRRLKELGYDERISFEGARGTSGGSGISQRLRELWVSS